jgi:plastocyanin
MADLMTGAASELRAPGVTTHAGGAGPSGSHRGVRPIWFVLAAVLLVGGASALVAIVASGDGTRSPKTFEYTVPEGTGAAIAAGQQLFVFPARLDLHVGDTIVIHNEDTRPAVVGPYTVDRNATLSQTFYRTGWVTGFCSIHPSGRVTIHITD